MISLVWEVRIGSFINVRLMSRSVEKSCQGVAGLTGMGVNYRLNKKRKKLRLRIDIELEIDVIPMVFYRAGGDI